MTGRWRLGNPDNYAGTWTYHVPCPSTKLSESNRHLGEIMKVVCETLKDFFVPDYVEIHWITRSEDYHRDSIREPSDMVSTEAHGTERFSKMVGYAPEEIQSLANGLARKGENHRQTFTVDLQGVTKIFDLDNRREIVETWESRLPQRSPGTLELSFQNRFPESFQFKIRARSSIFFTSVGSDFGMIDNAVIAEKNRLKLSEFLRRVEDAAGGKVVVWDSDYLDGRTELWEYGFR